jgi:putative colanic acid biosynthesis acetyltransferase WcaF
MEPISPSQNGATLSNQTDLSRYDNSWYQPGRGPIIRLFWYFANALFLQNPYNPSSRLNVAVLRAFGARIGKDVRIKPGVNVKYPWNLEIGNNSWIGESVWIDSLTSVTIGSHVCISQGAYLCTGNHNWSDPHFGLVVKSISVGDGAWIGAKATILPGTDLGNHCVITAGSVIGGVAKPYGIYRGNPALLLKKRIISSD